MQLHTGRALDLCWAQAPPSAAVRDCVHAGQAACIVCPTTGELRQGQMESSLVQHSACIISDTSSRRLSPIVIWSEANIVATSGDLLQVCALDGAMVTDLNLVLLASPAAGRHGSLAKLGCETCACKCVGNSLWHACGGSCHLSCILHLLSMMVRLPGPPPGAGLFLGSLSLAAAVSSLSSPG